MGKSILYIQLFIRNCFSFVPVLQQVDVDTTLSFLFFFLEKHKIIIIIISILINFFLFKQAKYIHT